MLSYDEEDEEDEDEDSDIFGDSDKEDDDDDDTKVFISRCSSKGCICQLSLKTFRYVAGKQNILWLFLSHSEHRPTILC